MRAGLTSSEFSKGDGSRHSDVEGFSLGTTIRRDIETGIDFFCYFVTDTVGLITHDYEPLLVQLHTVHIRAVKECSVHLHALLLEMAADIRNIGSHDLDTEMDPMEAWITFGFQISTQSAEAKMVEMPNHSARRIMVPMLPGSRTESRAR